MSEIVNEVFESEQLTDELIARLREELGDVEANKVVVKYYAMKPKNVIVSMTTIPARKKRLLQNLPAILGQSYKFSKLVINIDDNLTDDDYEFYESLKEKDERIIINKAEAKWRSCNKLLPTINMFPDDIIITVDDDVYYPIDCVKYLVDGYKKNANCVIAHEVNPIKLSRDKTFVSYINGYDIKIDQTQCGKYLSNCCLFPPHIFDWTDLYDYDKMMHCTDGAHDELWFWVQLTLNGVMCVGLNYVLSFQPDVIDEWQKGEYRLADINVSERTIQKYMSRINEMYGDRLIEQILKNKVCFTLDKENVQIFIAKLDNILDQYWYGIDVKINNLTKSWQNKIKDEINRRKNK